MALLLKVLSCSGEAVTREWQAEFADQGGSIGRHEKNTLVLPSPAVSGFHAVLVFRDGEYVLKDGEYEQQFAQSVLKKPSTNGTILLNADQTAIPLKGTEAVLHGQEKILIGEYEILVELQASKSAFLNLAQQRVFESLSAGPFAADQPKGLDAGLAAAFPPLPAASIDTQYGAVSPGLVDTSAGLSAIPGGMDFLSVPVLTVDLHPAPLAPGLQVFANRPADQAGNGLSAAVAAAPQLEPHSPAQKNPADILHKLVELYAAGSSGKAAAVQPALAPEPEPVSMTPLAVKETPVPAIRDHTDLLAAFFQGAGIDEVSILNAEQQLAAMRTAGTLFRSMVAGLMDELQARKVMKEEFRLSHTQLKPRDNNPLKFQPDVADFIKSMLSSDDPAFIRANDAVVEGFKDLKFHRLAMTAAFQASLHAHLSNFDPAVIEKATGSGNPLTKKSRCWELYCERFPALKNRAIQEIFGDDFADEYEKQMRQFSQQR